MVTELVGAVARFIELHNFTVDALATSSVPRVKVLVVSTEGAGHVSPLVPIIGALVAQGDAVLVASGPNAEAIVEKTGARFALAGRSQGEWMARLTGRLRGMPGDGLAPERILHYFLPRNSVRSVSTR